MPPATKLKEHHRVIAALVAMGWTNAEIEAEYGFHANYLSILRNSPQMKLLIQDEQRKIMDKLHDGFVARAIPFEQFMEDEEEENRRRWKTLRGQNDDLSVSLRAVESLWDRKYPKKQLREEERTLKLIIEGTDLTELAKAIAEDEGKPPIELAKSSYSTVKEPQPVRPVLPEELEE